MLGDHVRRAALRTAAKVALSMTATMTVSACGGMVEDTEGAAGSNPSPTPSATGTAAPTATTTATTTPTSVPTTVPTTTPSSTGTGASLHLRLDPSVIHTPPAQPGVCGLPATGEVPEAAELCCEAKIDQTIPSDTGWDWNTPLPADIVACCAVVVPFYDGLVTSGVEPAADHDLSWTQRYACCPYIDPMPIGPTCEPWGPPLPPEMPDERVSEMLAELVNALSSEVA